MSSYPNLQSLKETFFPSAGAVEQDFPSTQGIPVLRRIQNWIQRRSLTSPRSTAPTLRHPETQAGVVLSEDGQVAIRAGHKAQDHQVGASIILQQDGSVVIVAPAGLYISGDLSTTNSPTDFLSFSAGQYKIHPQWTTTTIVTPLLPDPTTLDKYFVLSAKGVPVPLSALLSLKNLYQTPTPAPIIPKQ